MPSVCQLFLEEERERELEQIYESGIADTMNREDHPIGSGDPESGGQAHAQNEATGVSKQTTETLMAGERISEALDLADAERVVIAEYEKAKEGLSEGDQMKVQPPQRNSLLAAYELEPEAWVLKVVSGIQNTALQDALLVLPFGKVMSLMVYLDIWARRVSFRNSSPICLQNFDFLIGMEYSTRVQNHVFPSEDSSPSNRRHSKHAHDTHSPPEAPACSSTSSKTEHRVQSRCFAVHQAPK